MNEGKPSKAPIIIFGNLVAMSIITVAVVFVSHYQNTDTYLDSKKRIVRYRTVTHSPTLSLNYSAFGPKILARDLLGDQWWQWQAYDDNDSKTIDDIKVVVYKGIGEEQLFKRFPIIEEKLMDYRYVKYADAIFYLNAHILENVNLAVTAKLSKTREKLIDHFL